MRQQTVGVDDDEGPPVPIPNTEVKLIGADDTWLATAWKNREMPTKEAIRMNSFLFYALSVALEEWQKIPQKNSCFFDTGGI